MKSPVPHLRHRPAELLGLLGFATATIAGERWFAAALRHYAARIPPTLPPPA